MATFTPVVTDKLKAIQLIKFMGFTKSLYIFNKQNIYDDFLIGWIKNILEIILYCYYATNDLNI